MKKYIYIIGIAILLTAACTDAPDKAAPKAVIEGWIDSDGYPIVIFTKSIVPSDKGGNAADLMIRWGKVTISDGVDTVILTGGTSDSFFPPYRYYNYTMKGVPGRTYTVIADFDRDIHAEATCRMPFPTPIDSVVFNRVDGNDTLRAAMLYFTAPSDCPAYYNVELRDSIRSGRSYPGTLGVVEAKVSGERMSVPILRPKHELDTIHYIPQLIRGERFEVSLCRIQQPVYEFWRTFNNDVMFGSSLFVGSHTPMPTNILGGYGVWSARGKSSIFVEVP